MGITRYFFGRRHLSIGIPEDCLEDAMNRVREAQRQWMAYSQDQVDEIFHVAALAASKERIPLARLAVEETQRGILEDKVIKNHFASEIIFNKYKNLKTVGVVEKDAAAGWSKLAEPVGPICAFSPVTNPTSTVIFKSLIALKTRNAIVFSPHPSAAKCSAKAAEIVSRAALKAGAPEMCISYLKEPTRKLSQKLLHHPEIKFALATGGPGVVEACYSSGNPAIGVGAGNAPALVDETADLDMACSSLVLSKTFDNGMICAAEQAVVVVDSVYEAFVEKLRARGVHFLRGDDAEKVGNTVIFDTLKVNPAIVGQSPATIARMASVTVPENALVLAAEVSEIGDHEKWSFEKLSPLMALYRARDFEDAVDKCVDLAKHGGAGHTAALYSSSKDRILTFETAMPVYHVLVDSPSSFGAIGDLYNFHIDPSLTLGCGTRGGNSVSKNVGPLELLNYKHVAEKRENMQWMRVPPTIFFKRGIIGDALADISDRRVFVVTDKNMVELGLADKVVDALHNCKVHVHSEIAPEPTFSCLLDGVKAMSQFKPDTVVALGGGSPLDAAKVMRLLYEHPEVKIQDLYARFLDIRKRINKFPKTGSLVDKLVEIPTTSGTGAEMTPFAVITGDDGHKYPIADYALTPDVAIVDPEFASGMPRALTAHTGYDVLTHAVESYVSVMATDYTQALSLRAVQLVDKYLERVVVDEAGGGEATEAREGMHNASAIAGIAFANAFLGISHSIAHALGAQFHLPHGLCNALVLSHVCRFNASTHPTKMAAFPQYKYPQAKKHYAQLADALNLTDASASVDEKFVAFVERIEQYKERIGIPLSIKDAGVSRLDFANAVTHLAEQAFDDQCTGANPRYPLISEIEQILWDAYEGPPVPTNPD